MSELLFEQREDAIQPPTVLGLHVGDPLQVRFDLIQPNTLTQRAATQRPHILPDIIEHVVDGMYISVALVDLAFDVGPGS